MRLDDAEVLCMIPWWSIVIIFVGAVVIGFVIAGGDDE